MSVGNAAGGFRCLVTRVAVVTLALGASGCTHSLLYDENRDRQGKQALQAVERVRLQATIESMQATFADLAAREEANAREQQLELFEQETSLVAEASSLDAKFSGSEDADGLITVLQGRLSALGVAQPQYRELQTTAARLDAALDTLTVRMIELRGVAGVRLRNCQEIYASAQDPQASDRTPSARFLAAVPPVKRELVRASFADLIEQCQQLDRLATSLRHAYPGGEIKNHTQELAALESDIQAHHLAKRQAREELDAAIEAFEGSGLEPTSGADTAALRSLEERAESLRKAIEKITKANQWLPARRQVIARETLARLEAALAAVAAQPADGAIVLEPEEQKAVAIVRAVPALKDEVDRLFRDANKPRLVPFLLAIEQQRLVVESFEASERARDKQLAAARQRLAAAMNEAGAIVATLGMLEPEWARRSLSDLNSSLSGRDRATLYRALATYADDVQRFRIDAAVWDARLRAAQHEEALVQSQYAAAQWDGLLDTLAKVLADYHATGIKRAELAEFFKALGWVALGIGVAQ